MIQPSKIIPEQDAKKFFKRLKQEKDRSLTVIKSNLDYAYPQEVANIVDYFLFSLIYNTGLRISEALKIETTNIGVDYIEIPKELSKNKKVGVIYFGEQTRSLIDDYIRFRQLYWPKLDGGILFPSRSIKIKHMSRSNIHSRFKKWLSRLSIPTSYSLHSLRHSYATRCLDNGLEITFVRDQLRHSNIATTSRYLHLTQKSRDKVKKLF